jgi:hypothetical protein
MDRDELKLFDNCTADAALMMQKKIDAVEKENTDLRQQLERSHVANRTLQERTLLRVSELMAQSKAADEASVAVAMDNARLLVRLTRAGEERDLADGRFEQLRGRVRNFLAVFEQTFSDPSGTEPGLLRLAMDGLREVVGHPPLTLE